MDYVQMVSSLDVLYLQTHVGHYHKSSNCFEYPLKNPYLNQATHCKQLSNFPTQNIF